MEKKWNMRECSEQRKAKEKTIVSIFYVGFKKKNFKKPPVHVDRKAWNKKDSRTKM